MKQDGVSPVLQRHPHGAAVESPTGSLNHRSGSSFSVAGKDEPVIAHTLLSAHNFLFPLTDRVLLRPYNGGGHRHQ